MLRAVQAVSCLWLSVLATFACGDRKEGMPDSELGTLVLAAEKVAIDIDVELAAQKPAELMHAASLSHGEVGRRLGAHRVTGSTRTRVEEAGSTVEELTTELGLQLDDEGQFVATLDNSRDYGRHVIYADGELFLRPRFGSYHGRAPSSDSEPESIRDAMFSEASDYLELFAHALLVRPKGEQTVGGRPAQIVIIELDRDAGRPATENLAQRRWRERATPRTLSGELAIDAATGVLLEMSFKGSLEFERDGETFVMHLEARRSITDIGKELLVSRPAEEQVVHITDRQREVFERNRLLDKIAPPEQTATSEGNP